jgi:hypothetical protein
MGDTLTVSMDTSKDVAQPTLEEEAAKYDNPPPADDRPEWLPEKFKSPEDLAKAYGELEKKFSTRTKELPVEETPTDENAEEENDNTDEPETVEDEARKTVEDAGLDFDELSTKYWENGELDQASYEKLEKAGIPKAIVDQYIAGQEALLTATRNSVYESVGGETRYAEMTQWAADNLSKDEVIAYNRAVNSGDMASAMMAVKGLKARYDADAGFEPSREVRGETAKTGASTYRSIAELEKDMGDKRYWNDPAFRKDVERKLARSNIF